MRGLIRSLAWLLVAPALVSAIGGPSCVTVDSPGENVFEVVSEGGITTPILLSTEDWAGVHRAAQDFADDIERVSGSRPLVFNATSANEQSSNSTIDAATSTLVLVGTLGKSNLISSLVDAGLLDVSSIEGQWESYIATTIATNSSLLGANVNLAYVIVGSDKRGTIYGLYEHSEQMGVSPWYWWADAPTQNHDSIQFTGCAAGPPSVQYRGIFLNDEQPALTNWAMDKFTNGTGAPQTGSPFNRYFHAHLFELILRMKGNYLWPALWGSAFCIDDELNQFLADYYGVVMGTSHHEPMARGTPIEWNLFGEGPWNYTSNAENVYNYFVGGAERAKPFETLFTLGMRGTGDLPLEDSYNIALLEKVVADQREILTNTYEGVDISTIPQMWCLYKEVQGYYEQGMRVPDDITLLWADDNWGNIRRFPTPSERDRPGGAGVYYHVDYVGGPRDYKWIATSQISKIWEQLTVAYDRNATRIWIVNVGDLKPSERETEFFLTLAYNTTQWTPTNLRSFETQWAMREFGVSSEDAEIIADITADLTMFNARRKPELWTETTYSLVNYREAERVMAGWNKIVEASTGIYDSLPDNAKPAYFQLVHHAVLASSTVQEMLITAGMNQLRASQASLTANVLAGRVEELFERDWEYEVEYHTMLDGKWNHIMDQTHLGYAYWQQPMQNSMPMVTKIMSKKIALPGPMRVTVEGTQGAWPGDNRYNCGQGYNCPPPSLILDQYNPISNGYFDVSSGGGELTFTWQATVNGTGLEVSSTSGTISPSDHETRVYVSVSDWGSFPVGTTTVAIDLAATVEGGLPKSQPNAGATVLVEVVKREDVPSGSGFVEATGVVSFEAAHTSRNESANGVAWFEIPGLGRTLSGVTPLPRVGNDDQPFAPGEGPLLEYSFYTFTPSSSLVNDTVNVIAYLSPSLNGYGSDRPLAFAVSLDGGQLQEVHHVPLSENPGSEPSEWGGLDGWVANSIITATIPFTGVEPGAHTLQVFMVEPAVVLQKVVIDLGGLAESYLGPPESIMV